MDNQVFTLIEVQVPHPPPTAAASNAPFIDSGTDHSSLTVLFQNPDELVPRTSELNL